MRKFKMSRPVMITWAILLILIITVLNGFKPWLRHPSEKELFFWDVAVNFNSPDICDKIHRWSYSWGDLAEIPMKYTRSNCYHDVAVKTGNPDLCKKVRPLSKFLVDGSRYREICYRETPKEIPPSSKKQWELSRDVDHSGYYKLTEIMPRLGFTEDRIRKDPQFVHYPAISVDYPLEELFVRFYIELEYDQTPRREEFLAAVRKF